MSEDRKVVGRKFSSTTVSELDDEGFWKVVATSTDSALYEGAEEWVTEQIESMSVDRNHAEAIQTAMSSVLSFLVENVYNKGFTGLVELREYERSLEKKGEAEAKDIQDS